MLTCTNTPYIVLLALSVVECQISDLPPFLKGLTVADTHQVIFYPVGNGDTTQIILSGGHRDFFVRLCHRNKAENSDIPEIDLKARLKDDLKKPDATTSM